MHALAKPCAQITANAKGPADCRDIAGCVFLRIG